MLSFILMIGFSIYLMTYGFIALFKRDLLWKIRNFSAKVEGKGSAKRDAENIENMNRVSKIMGTAALVLGAIGFIMTLAVMFIYMQSQGSVIDI